MSNSKDYYQQWYEKNRVERNERRREKYAANADLRARERERVRKYRAQQQVPEDEKGRVFREWKGKRVEVFRIGTVAEMTETNAGVIRRYEKEGLIPPSVFGGENRLYTAGQVTLIDEICQFKRNTRYGGRRKERKKYLDALVKKVKQVWEDA